MTLSNDDVRLILTSEVSAPKLAKQLGVSREAVRAVRRGQSHAELFPELRRTRYFCSQCIHWEQRCTLGFPDPIEEGQAFANDCVNFCDKRLLHKRFVTDDEITSSSNPEAPSMPAFS